MKKKLLVLSASAILASNFILDNNASAVVDTQHKNFKSDSLSLKEGNRYLTISVDDYKDNLGDLIMKQSINPFAGYDYDEYKNAYKKYQQRLLTELDAMNQFFFEEKQIAYHYRHNSQLPDDVYGLTHERYKSVYDTLKKNKLDFEKEVNVIEENNVDLRRFDYKDQSDALKKVYELEDKALMSARAFAFLRYKDDIDNLYNKLDIIVGKTTEERKVRIPTNKRMLDETCENLETIIDEFFKDIGYERPKEIEPLTSENQDNENILSKVRNDAKEAKLNPHLVDPGVKKRADKLKEANEKAKAEREAKAKELKEKGLLRGKAFTPQNYPLYFSHKKLKDHSQSDSKNELVFKETNEQPKELPTYTESITQSPQPVLKQQTREETFTLESAPRLNQSKPLNGLIGESNLVTMDESSNASTQFGSNAHVFEYSFDSTPKTTNIAKQNVKQENYNSVNNLAGMSGESQHVDFTQDSNPSTTYGGYGNAFDFTEDTAPKQPETITESHEIVLDYQTHATMSGFKTGVSTEAYYSSNELTK
ncbi:coagulase domain-containing protein [Staphylococcus hyicus]